MRIISERGGVFFDGARGLAYVAVLWEYRLE